MEGPSPARDCPALVNSSKLWELKGLKDVGILTQQQFERQVEHTLTEPGALSEAPPMKKRIHASLLRTAESVPLPSKQKSLFASGFWKEKTTQEGEVLLINGDARPISSPPVTHKCRFAPCDYRHQFKCSLALHEKKHSEWLQVQENFDKWKEERISASDRRIYLTHWYAEAWERMLKKFNIVKV